MSFQPSINEEEDESLLVGLVQSGDVAAFEKLLLRIYRPMRKYIGALAGEPAADDVLQEVAYKIYRQIRFLREPKAFRAWVYRIATRVAFVHLKRDKRRRHFETGQVTMDAIPAFESIDRQELGPELLHLIDRVSPASRAVLLLHYRQDLTLEETAAILDIPLGTAKSRLSYGVATLRNLLKEKEKR